MWGGFAVLFFSIYFVGPQTHLWDRTGVDEYTDEILMAIAEGVSQHRLCFLQIFVVHMHIIG